MTDKNFDYTELIEDFGEELVNEAIRYCREIAEMPEVRPSYNTDPDSFLPHAWVVAAMAGMIGQAKDRIQALEDMLYG